MENGGKKSGFIVNSNGMFATSFSNVVVVVVIIVCEKCIHRYSASIIDF